MRASIGMALLASGSAYAQLSFPNQVGPLHFSTSCKESIIQVLTNGSFAQCFRTYDLLPIITSPNASIVPVLDHFMSDICGPSDVCTNETLSQASMTILSGCSGDLKNESLSDSVVTTAFGLYPLVRDILCLKTNMPYTNMSYGGFLGNPAIPVTSSVYNSDNGTFCVTSLLTQLSAYYEHNITTSWIASAVMGQNMTAVNLTEMINPNILCNDCIFAAVDLIAEAYPAITNLSIVETVKAIYPNVTLGIPQNATIPSIMDGECAYNNQSVTTNGTLPMGIMETAQNMSMLNMTMSNMTMSGPMGPGPVNVSTSMMSMMSMMSMPSGSMMGSMASMAPTGSITGGPIGGPTASAPAASGSSSA